MRGMIYGIGVDMVKIARMAQSLGREGFARRVFSAEEQALWQGLPPARAAERAAGCFAAKEALLKAAGLGLGGFSLRDMAVLRKKSGAPCFALGGAALEFCESRNLAAHLSISHDGGMATAFVVLESAG